MHISQDVYLKGQKGLEIQQLNLVPLLKSQEPPAAPHCLRKNPKTTSFCPQDSQAQHVVLHPQFKGTLGLLL